MEQVTDIREAQERLERKRAQLAVTAQNIPSTTNFNEILEISRRCQEKYAARRAEIGIAMECIGDAEPEQKQTTKNLVCNSYVPVAYRDCTFDTFQGNDMLVEGLKKLSSTGCDIVLRGSTGCGKTHLAAAIMQEEKRGYFTTAPELLLRIRKTFNNGDGETESDVIDDLCRHDLLVLDDLGAEKTTEFAITTLYIIIDRRIRNAKRTIVTTNLSLNEIEEKLDARIASRLSGMQNVKINMPDYRKKRP